MISVVQSVEELHKIREDWTRLYDAMSFATIFQTYSFCSLSYQAAEGMPYALFCLAKNGKELRAILPCILRKGVLRIVNDKDTDFCDIIVSDAYRYDYHVYEELADFIKQDKRVKRVEFKNLRKDSTLLSYFKFFFSDALIYSDACYSIVEVTGNQQEPLVKNIPTLNTKERYRLKNIEKKAEGSKTKIFRSSEETYPLAVREIIESMISDKMREASYFSESMLRFFEELYNDGCINIAVTTNDNENVAASLMLPVANDRNSFILWISIYKERAHNLWNVLGILNDIKKTGAGKLNFARGWYPYKIHNFRPQLERLYSFHYAKGFCGKLSSLWVMDVYMLKQMLKPFAKKYIRR